MKHALITFILLNSIVVIICSRELEILAMMSGEKKEATFCGPQLNSAMKAFCNLDAARNGRRTKKSIDFGNGRLYESPLDKLFGYSDEDAFQSDWESQGYDWVPYYMIKRQGPNHETVTQACCKKPCRLEKLVEYCPIKRVQQ